MGISMEGRTGELRCGWYGAAKLSRWSLSTNESGTTCNMTFGEVSDYWLESGEPIDVILDVGKNRWRWQHVTFARTGPTTGTAQTNDKPEVL